MNFYKNLLCKCLSYHAHELYMDLPYIDLSVMKYTMDKRYFLAVNKLFRSFFRPVSFCSYIWSIIKCTYDWTVDIGENARIYLQILTNILQSQKNTRIYTTLWYLICRWKYYNIESKNEHSQKRKIRMWNFHWSL